MLKPNLKEILFFINVLVHEKKCWKPYTSNRYRLLKQVPSPLPPPPLSPLLMAIRKIHNVVGTDIMPGDGIRSYLSFIHHRGKEREDGWIFKSFPRNN